MYDAKRFLPCAWGRHRYVNSDGIDSAERQILFEALHTFDDVLAMDRRNLAFLLRHAASAGAEVRLLPRRP